MNSLREEINNEIDLATRDKRISPSNYTQLTNEILKLFEKRIDSRINKLVIGKGIVEFKDNIDVLEELQEIKEMLK